MEIRKEGKTRKGLGFRRCRNF